MAGYDGYESFTEDNFIIEIPSNTSIGSGGGVYISSVAASASCSKTKSYNSNTGTLTARYNLWVSNGSDYYGSNSARSTNIDVHAYLVRVEFYSSTIW